MSAAMIELDGVAKSYGLRPVLHDLTFAVREGEIAGLIGPNGSGKTTTIRLMNGVIRPRTGRIRVSGHDPATGGDAIRSLSGILTESAGFYVHLTALENLRFFGALYGMKGDGRALELLEEFGLLPHKNQKVGTYSTGMKKRLGLAKALLHRPRLLFLDEPTNGLDPEGIRMVLSYIRGLNQRDGTTMILCSHLLQQLETVCHRYLFLQPGAAGARLIEQGTLAELEDRYGGQALLQVETDLALEGTEYRGVPATRLDSGLLQFTLPGKAAVPEFLRALTQEAQVYSAQMAGLDLESLYFKIREGVRHE